MRALWVVALFLTLALALVLFIPTVYASTSDGDDANTEDWQIHYAVNGFVNSGEPDPYQIFKIHYRVINGTVEKFGMPYFEYSHYIQANVTSNGNAMLEIRFPKNYPSYEGGEPVSAITFLNEQEIVREQYGDDSCFIDFLIPLSESGTVDVVWTTIFSGRPFQGLDVPESCIPETLVQDVVRTKDGIIPPLHQVKAGVLPDEVACGDAFELITHPNDRRFCCSPGSIEMLKERWF